MPMFLKLPGFAGNSKDPSHRGEIEFDGISGLPELWKTTLRVFRERTSADALTMKLMRLAYEKQRFSQIVFLLDIPEIRITARMARVQSFSVEVDIYDGTVKEELTLVYFHSVIHDKNGDIITNIATYPNLDF